MSEQHILIAGGYGVVGRCIAADLARDYPVILAGRHLEHANVAAAELGHGVRGRQLDITDDASISTALRDVAAVVSCIDQPRRRLLRAAIQRGLRYTDITPHLMELGRGAAYDELDAGARKSGACVVLGTGIVPGISNVMVRALADRLGGADVIETSLLLSASDTIGPASSDYFLKELTMPFEVHVKSADHPACAFSKPRTIEFPPPFGPRAAYLFPFSDQVLYPRTMGAHTTLTRLALEPAMLGRLLAMLVRVDGTRLVAMRRRLAFVRQGSDRAYEHPAFALRVDVEHGDRSAVATLVGPAQADAAAAGASATVRVLMQNEVSRPGVWMPEQVIEPSSFFSDLARHGLIVQLPHTEPVSAHSGGIRADRR